MIVGDNDVFTTESEMSDMAQKIKQVTFVVIPKAGHMPNMEQPSVFNQAILSFYEKRT
jgi:pimeloyl-ACP methyl ester carboxylesterase